MSRESKVHYSVCSNFNGSDLTELVQRPVGIGQWLDPVELKTKGDATLLDNTGSYVVIIYTAI